MEKFDFHMHSTCSDGSLSVKEIVDYAKAKSFEMIAITDHDDIGSIELIKKCDLGNLKCVPGIEVSATFEGYKMHIVCLGFRRTDAIGKIVAYQKWLRVEKAKDMLEKLKKLFKFTFRDYDVEALLKANSVGKNHIASLMLKYGYATTRDAAFDCYINKIPKANLQRVSLESVVDAMKQDDGFVIMAHPYETMLDCKITEKILYEIMNKALEAGCIGIEAYHSGSALNECKRLEDFARSKNCLISFASDFHRVTDLNSCARIGHCYRCPPKEYVEIGNRDNSIYNLLNAEKRWIK